MITNAIVTGEKTVTSTAAAMFAGASVLNRRKRMIVTNTGANTVYLGAAGVTSSNGFPLPAGECYDIDFAYPDGATVMDVYAVSTGSTVRVMEVK